MKKGKYHVVIGILAVIYAICAVLGSNIEKYGYGQYTSISTYRDLILYSIVFKVLIDVIVIIANRLGKVDWIKKPIQIKCKDSIFFFVCWVIFILSWLPTYIACYPGLAIYDGPSQTYNWSRHHPFVHTALIHLCRVISEKGLCDNWVVAYCAIQFILFSAAMAYIVLRLKRLSVKTVYLIALIVLTCVFPMNALLAITTTKDVLFSVIFAIWVIEVINVITNAKEYWNSKWNIIRFILFSFLLCAFRNNGIYVLVATAIILVFFLDANRKRWIVTTLSVAILFGILNGPVLTMAGVPKGDMREALSVIIQPLSRAYNYAGEVMPQEDKEQIEKLFGDAVPWYIGHISDPPKSQFDSEEFKADMTKYMRLFIHEGLEYPTIYADAWIAVTYGNWYPFETLPDDTCFRVYFEFPDRTAEEYGSSLNGYYTFLQNFSRESSFSSIPPLKFLFSNGLAFWIILAEIAYGIMKKDKKIILMTIPSIMLWGTIMLGPVALFRYTYPLMLVNCIVIGVIWSKHSYEINEQ